VKDTIDDLSDKEFLYLLNKDLRVVDYYRLTKKTREGYIRKRPSYDTLDDLLRSDNNQDLLK
jgi:hypothetical protein